MAAQKRDPLLTISVVVVIAFVVATMAFAPDPLSGIRDRFVVLGILIVSVVAQWRGTRAGVVAAVVAFLAIGAAVPRATFLSFAAPRDVFVDLFIFLGVALVQGVQTGHLREREEAAAESERRMSLLSRLGSRLVPGGARPVTSDLLDELANLVGAPHAVLLVTDAIGCLRAAETESRAWIEQRPDACQIAEQALDTRRVAGNDLDRTEQTGSTKRTSGGIALPVLAGDRPLGAVYVSARLDGRPFSPQDMDFLLLVANELSSYLDRERLQEEMAETAAQIAGDRLKSSLVASVSHEIRTPLSAATAIVSGLVEEHPRVTDSRFWEDLRSAQESLELLNRQIGDLLDISRLETSSWEPSLDWNDLHDLCAPLLARVPQSMRHRVSCVLPDNLPLLRFDPVQLIRALGHILENALAYSDEDSTVTISGSADESCVRIWIQDRGPGLSPSEKEQVFQKFYRGGASSLSPHGSGLGLAIAQDIVSYHGGVIRVKDVEPHGARFIVDLPIASEEPRGSV